MNFLFGVMLSIMTFAASGIAAGLVQKHLGLLSVGHMLVMGFGAYTYALLAKSGVPVAVAFAAAACTGLLAGAALTLLGARVTEERYALTTFGIHIVWLGLVSNVEVLTRGVLGITGIPTPATTWLGLLGFGVFGMACWLYRGMRGLPLAVGCAIVRRSTELAMTLGIRHIRIILLLGALYGAILGMAGAILAAYLTVIDPTVFALSGAVSILVVAFFVVTQGVWVGLLGAVVLIGGPQVTRLFGISSVTAGYLQLAISGLGLMVFAIYSFSHSEQSSENATDIT